MADKMQQLVPYAQVVGLSGASAIAAYIGSYSHFGVPTVGLASGASDLMVKQWSRMFHIGLKTVPPAAGLVSICFALAAYQARDSTKRALYAAAAGLPICIPVYTRVVMWSGIQALEVAAAGGAGAPSGAQVKSLIAAWNAQNVRRALIAASAAFCGAAAMVL